MAEIQLTRKGISLSYSMRKKLFFLMNYSKANIDFFDNVLIYFSNEYIDKKFFAKIIETVTRYVKENLQEYAFKKYIRSQFKIEAEKANDDFKKVYGDLSSFIETDCYYALNGSFSSLDKDLIDNLLDNLEIIINSAYTAALYNTKYAQFDDIATVSDYIMDEIERYVKDPKKKEEFLNRFKDSIVRYDVEEALSLVRELNNYNKLDWIRKMYNPKLDKDNFEFIGHSVGYLKAFNENSETYVSCKLYNNEHIYCFNQKFGFIINPASIIVAADHDLYTVNTAANDKELFKKAELQFISSVDSVREHSEVVKYFEQRERSDNEIIARGFNPLGIFRFVYGIDGMDEDDNFRSFIKANRGYDIYTYDILECSKGDELKTILYSFIGELTRSRLQDAEFWHSDDLEAYQSFLNNLSSLKKQRKVKRSEAIRLFLKYFKTINTTAEAKEWIKEKNDWLKHSKS